jgi:putative endonuclease
VKFIYGEELEYIWDAIEREKQIKKWSRKKKEALVVGNMEKLQALAKSKVTPRQARGDKINLERN